MKSILFISILFFPTTSCAMMLPNKPVTSCPVESRISKYDELVHDSAREFKLDPALIFSVVEAESGFNPRARSHAGAKGLMQLMGPTARNMGVRDVFHPAQNIHGGTKYLRLMYDRYDGNLPLALAAYNLGPARVKNTVPSKAKKYVRKVLELKQEYKERIKG